MSGNEDRTEEGVPEWVVTFADLMTLLFCFFVLLTTLSTQPKNCSGLQNYFDANKERFQNYELRSSKLECIVSLPSDFLFHSGGDQIQERAFKDMIPLFRQIQELEEHQQDIMIVEGHTDNVPIRTRRFPSNWELSSARATNVATFLVNRMKFPEEKVSVSAFAENKPKIDYKDDFGKPLEGKALRQARSVNRRVEIVLVKKPESRSKTRLLFTSE